ncbi:hypothetical protein BVRB_6g148780 [Beta vulgaris subsp. vulgaris]|nr:hypothetical protein BVRB_6g148780 [Beta vulgaris subsp. vulgaris]
MLFNLNQQICNAENISSGLLDSSCISLLKMKQALYFPPT